MLEFGNVSNVILNNIVFNFRCWDFLRTASLHICFCSFRMSTEGENSRKRLCVDDVSVQSANEKKVESMTDMPLETKENICHSEAAICGPMGEILDSGSDIRKEETEKMDFSAEPSEQVAARQSKELGEGKTGEGLKDLPDKTSVKDMQGSELARGQKRKLDNDADLNDESAGVKGKLVENSLQMEEEAQILVEEDVGITEFISQLAGFSGTIKQR